MKANLLKSSEVMLRYAKTLLQNTIAVIAVVALTGSLLACDDTDDSEVYINQKMRVVAIPDFVFKCSDFVLSSTTNTLETRAEKEHITLSNGERMEVTDQVSARLYVAADNDQFETLRTWTDTDFRAVLLSLYFRTPTDVAVFLPLSAQYFTYNNRHALDMMAKSYVSSIQPSNHISKLKTIYGEASMTCLVSSDTVVAKVGYGRIENGTEGVEVTITGVTDNVIAYLKRAFNEGIQIDIWNYFMPTITRDALRDNFNRGATIDFSERPYIYVNEFKRVNNCQETVYSKVDSETGMQIPYKDKECTELLDSKYWVRPARSDGSPSKDYLLLRHKNEWDCTVKFSGEQYPLVHENNADVPYDVETKYYQLPDNYNIYYIDRE